MTKMPPNRKEILDRISGFALLSFLSAVACFEQSLLRGSQQFKSIT
jgi:hypothetical protein